MTPVRSGEVPLPEGRAVADRAVDDEAGAAAQQRVLQEQLADQGIVQVATPIDHQHVAGLHVHHRLVDGEVVAGTRLDGHGGADELAVPMEPV